MHSNTKFLNKRDQIFFEKAIKFYFFSRQKDIKSLKKDISDRIVYSRSVAYSLITTYIRSGSLKIEYMDFINQELKILSGLSKGTFQNLQVLPNEIDDIELMDPSKFTVFDEDLKENLEIYYSASESTAIIKKADTKKRF
jgi:hypothetical protein